MDSSKANGLLDLMYKFIKEELKLWNPLKVAENLKESDSSIISNSDLWNLMGRYKNNNPVISDIGMCFLMRKNYHGAHIAFKESRYVPGLIEMTQMIVHEVKTGNMYNIGYAKKALDDIVKLEGRGQVKEYISVIAHAYEREYNRMLKEHIPNRDYLIEARSLYLMNNNIAQALKVSSRMFYHGISGVYSHNSQKSLPTDSHFML